MKEDNIYRENFDSWLDFVQAASTRSGNELNNKSLEPGDPSFHGTDTYGEAEKLAYCGWHDGLKLLSEMKEIVNIKGDTGYTNTEHYDHGGAFVDVGRFCEGVPECMIDFQEKETIGSNVITISVNIGALVSVKKKTITRRGVAIVSLVDALESSGKRVEIEMVSRAKNKFSPEIAVVTVKLKKPDEPLDIERVLFALAHPSTLRRLVFSVREKFDDFIRKGYGASQDYESDADIALSKALTSNPDCFSSDSKAAQWVKDQLILQGIELEPAGA